MLTHCIMFKNGLLLILNKKTESEKTMFCVCARECVRVCVLCIDYKMKENSSNLEKNQPIWMRFYKNRFSLNCFAKWTITEHKMINQTEVVEYKYIRPNSIWSQMKKLTEIQYTEANSKQTAKRITFSHSQ